VVSERYPIRITINVVILVRQSSRLRRAYGFLLCCCVCAAASYAQDVVGDVYATDASVRGSIALVGSGTRVLSGSTVNAGLAAATVKLARGGAVRVCPGTNVALSTSQSGRVLAMGFNSGAVELHYELASSADTLQTSDFRLLLAGPGTFNLAVSADRLGNTCVKPMAQNSSSVIVQELFGDATYQVKADEAVVFRKGKVTDVSREVPPDCGCPAPPEVRRAETEPSQRRRGDTEEPKAKLAAAPPNDQVAPVVAGPAVADIPPCKVEPAGATTPAPPCGEPQPASLAALTPGAEVETPFVFHADPAVPDPPVIANVRLGDRGRMIALQPIVLPPQADNTKVAATESGNSAKLPAPKTFLGKVRSFFATLFK
jgi:hypothetical protein